MKLRVATLRSRQRLGKGIEEFLEIGKTESLAVQEVFTELAEG